MDIVKRKLMLVTIGNKRVKKLKPVFRPMKANPDSGIREIFACGIWNPGLWNPEYSSRNPESHQRLKSGIQIPLTKNLESGIQNPRLSWILFYMGRTPI